MTLHRKKGLRNKIALFYLNRDSQNPKDMIHLHESTHKQGLKRTYMKRTPSSPLKKAKKAADIAFSKYIRARDQACKLEGLDKIRCGGVLQCMHLVTRGVYGLRYDEINALGGCQGHHVYYTNHPEEWYLLLEKKFKDRFDYVMEWKNDETPRFKLSDYQELARYYTNKLEDSEYI